MSLLITYQFRNAMKNVIVVGGAGVIGRAIARRVGAGKHVVLADRNKESADAAAQSFRDAGFEASTAIVEMSSRASVHALVQTATEIGPITGVILAGGVSASQVPAATVLQVDLYGTALVLEEFGAVIAPGGAAVVISSISGHRLPALTPEQDKELATTPVDELLALPMLQPDKVTDPLNAYQIAKRGNSLRVLAEAVRWGKRGAPRQRRADGATRRSVPKYDRAVSCRALRHTGRSSDACGTSYGGRRRFHHRRRLLDRRWRNRRLLVWRASTASHKVKNPIILGANGTFAKSVIEILVNDDRYQIDVVCPKQ
jgi:NAD(P)-dependent dehydrogenase (short-subunit alcohol dehydrogenase family)